MQIREHIDSSRPALILHPSGTTVSFAEMESRANRLAHYLRDAGLCDVGHLDNVGRLYVDGRSDDMIVSGGENVYPAEVERLLGSHPSVVEAAVLGVPDEQYGQRLAAFVVLHSDADPLALPGELRNMVRDNLARHKVPRSIEVIEELPRNAAGKVVKRDLLSRVTKGQPRE